MRPYPPRILWALEQPCLLRKGKHWDQPITARDQLEFAWRYREWDLCDSPGNLRVLLEEIYIERWIPSLGTLTNLGEKAWFYPGEGFELQEKYPSLGGIQGLKELCGACSACITVPPIAGCTGEITYASQTPEQEDVLIPLAVHLGIREVLKTYFQPTTPLWYGLWIKSPLPQEGLPLLRQLLTLYLPYVVSPVTGTYTSLHEYTQLVEAIKVAEVHRIPLHVAQIPGGAGGIMPHCFRCKAWQKPGRNVICTVCGQRCSPRWLQWLRTAPQGKPLLAVLGEERFRQLTESALRTQGLLEDEIPNLLEIIVRSERQRPETEAAYFAERKRKEEVHD